MHIWRRDTHTQQIQAHPENEPLIITSPTVIYLPGVTTTDDLPKRLDETGPEFREFLTAISPRVNISHLLEGDLHKKVSGNMRLVDVLLGYNTGANDRVEPICISYRDSNDATREMHATNARPHSYYSTDALRLAEKLLLHNIADAFHARQNEKSGEWQVSGRKKDADAIIDALNNITIVQQSYGTSVLVQIENATSQAMDKLGFTLAEKKQILKSICAYGTGTVVRRKDLKDARFRAITVEGGPDWVAHVLNADKMAVLGEYWPVLTESLEQIKIPEDMLHILQTNEENLLIIASVNPRLSYWNNKQKTPVLIDIDDDRNGHYVLHFVKRGLLASILPEISERVVRNAVLRKTHPVGHVQDLLRPAGPLCAPEHSRQSSEVDKLTECLTKMIEFALSNQRAIIGPIRR